MEIEAILKKYCVILVIILLFFLYGFHCAIKRCEYKIEDLQKEIETIKVNNGKLTDGLCFKNFTPYCIQYKKDKQLIKEIFSN